MFSLLPQSCDSKPWKKPGKDQKATSIMAVSSFHVNGSTGMWAYPFFPCQSSLAKEHGHSASDNSEWELMKVNKKRKRKTCFGLNDLSNVKKQLLNLNFFYLDHPGFRSSWMPPSNFFFSCSERSFLAHSEGPSSSASRAPFLCWGIHPFAFIVLSWQIFVKLSCWSESPSPALGKKGLSSETVVGFQHSSSLAACLETITTTTQGQGPLCIEWVRMFVVVLSIWTVVRHLG